MSEFPSNDVLESSKSTECDSTNSKKRFESVILWHDHVRSIQLEKASPEVIERMKLVSERTKRAHTSYQTCSRIERVNYLSTMNTGTTLTSFQQTPMRSPESSFTHTTNTRKLHKLLHRSSQPMSYPPIQDGISVAPAAVSVADSLDAKFDFDVEEQQELEEMEANLGVNSSNITESDTNAAAFNVDILLKQLEVEPDNDADLSAKFILYENFLESVTTIRITLLEFWDQNKDQFDENIQQAQNKQIRDLDCNDNLAIYDESRCWFVYDMTKQANKNSKLISSILSSIKGKLALLLHELGECPFCLDQLTTDNMLLLTCCHRVCKECWENWYKIKKNHAFCPLCNSKQFISELIETGSR